MISYESGGVAFIDALEALAEGSNQFTNTRFVREVVRSQLSDAYVKQDREIYRSVFGDKWQIHPQGYRPRNMWERGASTAIDLAELASNRMVELNKQVALEGLAAHFGVEIGGLFDEHWSRNYARANDDVENYQPESFRYALDTLNAIKFALDTAE